MGCCFARFDGVIMCSQTVSRIFLHDGLSRSGRLMPVLRDSFLVTPFVLVLLISLAQAGASVVDMQVAGRWKSSQMPAHYAKAELAERGAIARFKDGKGK